MNVKQQRLGVLLADLANARIALKVRGDEVAAAWAAVDDANRRASDAGQRTGRFAFELLTEKRRHRRDLERMGAYNLALLNLCDIAERPGLPEGLADELRSLCGLVHRDPTDFDSQRTIDVERHATV